MNVGKDDTERVVNLLKIYKAKLHKSDDKELRDTMERLIVLLESEIYTSLLDIRELYEDTLLSANIVAEQPKEQVNVEQYTLEERQTQINTPRDEMPKKTKRHNKYREGSDEIADIEMPVELPHTQPSTSQGEMSKKSKRQHKSREKSDKTDIELPESSIPIFDETKYEKQQVELEEECPEEMVEEQNCWEYEEIVLNKGKKGYGFAIGGGFDKNHYDGDSSIFVTKIVPGGTAEVDGRLRLDDAIISVNDTNLEYVLHDTAVEILKNTGKSMTLTIRRYKEPLEGEYPSNLEYYDRDEQPEDAAVDLYSLPVEQYNDQDALDVREFHEFEVILTKKPGAGLGFSISGGYNNEDPELDSFVYISRITPGGVADADGRLQLDDVILMVNGEPLNKRSYDECLSLLKNSGQTVKLVVGRFFEDVVEEPIEVIPDVVEEPVEIKRERKKKKHKRNRQEE